MVYGCTPAIHIKNNVKYHIIVSIDQRAPQIGYEGIKSLRSLDMKNYLVTRGLSSLVESYNNIFYMFTDIAQNN